VPLARPQLHRVRFASRGDATTASSNKISDSGGGATLSAVTALCPNLRSLAITDCAWPRWGADSSGRPGREDAASADAAAGILTLRHLETLRLAWSVGPPDEEEARGRPMREIVARLLQPRRGLEGQSPTPLQRLHKLVLCGRLDAAAVDALTAYLADAPGASSRLQKLKLSTSVLASPGGTALLQPLASHPTLQKLSIVRPSLPPEGAAIGGGSGGEPQLHRLHCALVGRAVQANRSLRALHVRRCGLRAEGLLAMVQPPSAAGAGGGAVAGAGWGHLRRLKLDGNGLGLQQAASGGAADGSGPAAAFAAAIDALLAHAPRLESLHLGANLLDGPAAESLAAAGARHGAFSKLKSLTLGSNPLGDEGLAAILKVATQAAGCGGGSCAPLLQLYVHGVEMTDRSVPALVDALARCPQLWGLGLNGNPVTDVGASALAVALRGRTALRDVGIALSDVTDAGVGLLGAALRVCPRLRFVYLYNEGYKASVRVSEDAKAALKRSLPPHATAAFDHYCSRYLKAP